MADVDLDAVIRKLAKQQRKTLMAAVKAKKDRFNALGAKAKDIGGKQRYKQLAKIALEEGSAAITRWERSADNIADSYARSMRRALEETQPKKEAPVKAAPTPKPLAPKKAARKRKA